MSKEIYLVRHAESEHNAINNVFSGISNISISEYGKKQAGDLRGILESIGIDEVYCSSLKRAVETAKIVFGLSVHINYMDDLMEMNFGDYEGLYFDPMNYKDELFKLWLNEPSQLSFPNGDSIIEHANNMYNAIEHIVSNSKAERIAIISHSASIRLFVCKVLGLHLDCFRRIPCDNCSITKLTYKDSFKLDSCNCTYYGDSNE